MALPTLPPRAKLVARITEIARQGKTKTAISLGQLKAGVEGFNGRIYDTAPDAHHFGELELRLILDELYGDVPQAPDEELNL